MEKFKKIYMKCEPILSIPLCRIVNFITVLLSKIVAAYDYSSYPKSIKRSENGKIAVLVPIIPDLSHTFIYREILAMKKQGASFIVVGLLKGDFVVVHPEAAELLGETIFLRRPAFLGLLLLYFKYLLLKPRNVIRMINYFTANCPEISDGFLKTEHAYNLLHPMQSLLLTDLLVRHNVTYIHAYGASFPATMALGASVLLDIPYSISTFVDFEHDYEFKLLNNKLESSDFVVVCTKYCKNRMLSLTSEEYASKIHVIYSSIDKSYCKYGTIGGTSSDIRIVCVARFVEKKGIEYLIKACSILHNQNKRFKCMIIGNGEERVKYEAMINELYLDNVIDLLPPMANDQIKLLYGKDSIVVMPCVNARDGERDGIPNVLLEGMQCGSPAVATNISGIPELIIDGENGFIVPEKDPIALARALSRLLSSADLRENISTQGRQTVLTHFNLQEKAAERWSLINKSCNNYANSMLKGNI